MTDSTEPTLTRLAVLITKHVISKKQTQKRPNQGAANDIPPQLIFFDFEQDSRTMI